MLQSLRTPALWMVGASFAFACMAACVKLAAGHGIPTGQILFYRGAVALVIISAYLYLYRIPAATPHWKAQVVRSAVSLLAMLLYFTAIALLPLTTAVTLAYVSPLILALLLVVIYRERMHLPMIVAMLAGLCGVALLLRPTFAASQWLGGVVALGAAAVGAVSALNMRKLGRLDEPPARTVFYFSLVVTAGAAPALAVADPAPFDLEGAAYVLGTGIFATAGQAMIALAYQRGHTMLVSLLGYTQVVFTSLLAILIWNDRLSPLSWAGMALVILSGAVATMSPQASSRAKESARLGP